MLAVTFTNRAAGEMRGRLRQLGAGGVQARTFHSAALRQLQYFWPKAVGGGLRLIDRKIQLVADAAAACGVRLDQDQLRDVKAEMESSKVTQTVPADYAAAAAKTGRLSPRDPAEIAQLYATYEDLKRDRAVIDFWNILLLTIGELQDRRRSSPAGRSSISTSWSAAQDVNHLQQRLLELWLGKRKPSLCVVGDAGPGSDLFVHRCNSRPPARLPHPPPRGHRRQARPRLPLLTPGGAPRQRPALQARERASTTAWN